MLNQQVIVVTGASGELGRAVVAELLAQGARPALVGRRAPQAPEGGTAWAADAGSLADMRRCLDAIAQAHGGIDGLVNVAGSFRWQTFVGSDTLAEWDELHAANLRSCVNACGAAVPHLLARGRGRMVNIGAAAAHKASAGMGAYAASKAGVARLTEALADELKLKRITVNAVLPSIMDTPANRADMPDADFSRWVPTADVARVIAFLLSDAAASVTGALLPVTGQT